MEAKVTNKKALVKALICVIVSFILYKVFSLLINKLPFDYILLTFLKEACFLAIVVVAAIIVKKLFLLKPKKHFWIGILVGWWFIFQPFMTLWTSWAQGHVGAPTVAASRIGLFVLTMLMLGICEELLFRGILLNGFLEVLGDDSASHIRKAVIFAGILFGLAHAFNVTAGASVAGSLAQALANVGSGTLFGAMYIRSRRNLWPGIIAHAWLDGLGLLAAGILTGATLISTISSYSFLVVIPGVIEFCFALWAMRKKKLLPLINEAK